jgi:hypothetical protein
MVAGASDGKMSSVSSSEERKRLSEASVVIFLISRALLAELADAP